MVPPPASPRPALDAADYVVLVVRDLDASLRFYTEVLGLALGHRSGAYAQLDTGRTRIALYERVAMSGVVGFALETPGPSAVGFELGFKVADVDEAFAAFRDAGAEAVCDPTDRAWGQRTAYLRDPDGYLIELAQTL